MVSDNDGGCYLHRFWQRVLRHAIGWLDQVGHQRETPP